VTRLRKLATDCEFGGNQNDQICDRVVSGCRASKLRKRLLAEKDLTLDKVLEIGQSMEAAKTQARHIEQNNMKQTGETVNAMQKQNNYRKKGGFHNKNRQSRGTQSNHHQHQQNLATTCSNNIASCVDVVVP